MPNNNILKDTYTNSTNDYNYFLQTLIGVLGRQPFFRNFQSTFGTVN